MTRGLPCRSSAISPEPVPDCDPGAYEILCLHLSTRQESRLSSPFLRRGNEGDASEARVAYAPDGAHPPLTAFAAPFAREGGYLLSCRVNSPSCSPCLAAGLRHGPKIRYGWVASPYPTGTFTPQDAPSFARRDNIWVDRRGHRACPAWPACS